jgi:octaprenyl-diphosphate synthase
LFSTGLDLALKEKQFVVLQILNQAIKELSEGELLQIEKARNLDIDESVYYENHSAEDSFLIAAFRVPPALHPLCDDDILIGKIKQIGEWIGMGLFRLKMISLILVMIISANHIGIDIKEKKIDFGR